MTLSRRDFLKLAGLVAAGSALSACQPIYAQIGGPAETLAHASGSPLPLSDFRALNRLTFGPRLSERQRVAEIGLGNWIEEQLAPETIDDAPADWCLRPFDVLHLSADALFGRGNMLLDDFDPSEVINDFKQATLLRQVYTRRQLYEIMTEFWTDHFNISVDKGEHCWYLKVVDDREVIRPHVLGNFRDLLWASAHSPAMLVYLDNQANHKDAPNENYARELMELHTLGVEGGYTQKDVMQLARCLTGWSVKEHFWRGDFTFNEDSHYSGPKTVLGHMIPEGGQREAEQALDVLVDHPATAHFIAAKLVRRLVGDPPPPALAAQAAQTFLQNRGDIKAVLRTILLDGPPPGENQPAPRFKRPVNFIVSALRALNAKTDGGAPLHRALATMGQPLYQWPTPDGPPDKADSWVGNLLPRWRFALDLARNQLDGTEIDLEAFVNLTEADTIETFLAQIAPLLLGSPLPADARAQMSASLRAAGAGDTLETAAVIVAGLLASPAFQWQ